MNGTGKWLLGIASALIVGLIGWSLHTTQLHDVALAEQRAVTAELARDLEALKKTQEKEAADVEKIDDLIRRFELDIRKGERR